MGRYVMLLEDDLLIAHIIKIILTEEGYVVDSFLSIKELVEALGDKVPDLLLMDVHLPDGSGIDLCCHLKAAPKTVDIPIIMMSAHAAIKDMAKQCPANEFIEKPFDIDDLLSIVSLYCEKKHDKS